jgi:hypothetical protein
MKYEISVLNCCGNGRDHAIDDFNRIGKALKIKETNVSLLRKIQLPGFPAHFPCNGKSNFPGSPLKREQEKPGKNPYPTRIHVRGQSARKSLLTNLY